MPVATGRNCTLFFLFFLSQHPYDNGASSKSSSSYHSRESETVSFKVELRDRSNLREPPQVRRFAVDKDDCTCLAYLHDELLVLFPRLRQHVYEISWIDKDGDDVIIGTNEELVIALKEMHALKDTRGSLYRIRVTVRGQTTQQARQQMNGVGGYHEGIFCDSCNNSVFGFR